MKILQVQTHYSVYTPFTRNCLVLVDGEQLSEVKIQSDLKKRNNNDIHASRKTLSNACRAIGPLQLGVKWSVFYQNYGKQPASYPGQFALSELQEEAWNRAR